MIQAINWEQWEELMNSMNYEFEYAETYGANELPTGRQDKDLPFNNLLVRQAMNLAVDKEAILNDYYKGHGLLKGWPYYDTPAFDGLYTPLEELPAEPMIEGSNCSVQELIKGGNPEKARQLLTDAGYPDGFRTTIYSGATDDSDFLSIIKGYLEDVNIDMEIKTVEIGVFQSMERGRTWEEMWYKPTKQYFLPHYMFELRPESNDCAAFFEDARTREVLEIINENLAVNDDAWRKALKDITPYILEQSIAIWVPVVNKYNCWQPWLKNYYGAGTIAAFLPFHHTYYNWLDIDKKQEILGK
jgi:peptide/nickel transport system substrate-binding protein